MGLRDCKTLRRVAAHFAVLGLLLQASFAVVHSSAMASHLLAPGAGQDSRGYAVICTPQGLKRIRLDGDFGQEEAPQQNIPQETCSICLTFAGVGFVLDCQHSGFSPSHCARCVSERASYDVPDDGLRLIHIFVRGPPLQA